MGIISDDLLALYDVAFGTQRLTFGSAKAYGYFDQEETLQADGTGDNLLIKRTVFRMLKPETGSTMSNLTQDSSVTIYDPETNDSTDYVVSDTELIGDGREMRVIMRLSE